MERLDPVVISITIPPCVNLFDLSAFIACYIVQVLCSKFVSRIKLKKALRNLYSKNIVLIIKIINFRGDVTNTSAKRQHYFCVGSSSDLRPTSSSKTKRAMLCEESKVNSRQKKAMPTIVVGGRHLWLFRLLRAAEYVLYTYFTYHTHTLCIYTSTQMYSGPSAITKGCPSTTVMSNMES